MPVTAEKKESVTTIILSRPAVRNAVDRQTAEQLADAFRQFEADQGARAAVLYGDHGNFCSGADLKAIAAGQSNR
ncbi:MAG TPA: enoyl-CoA hydratase-related protein, partial [Blastocatellia bacterium]|nr:enoyl-CoA hydratase-related protein [Blastocatellia bacterium]